MRDERAAGAVPGPPSTGARTGAIGRTLSRIRHILSRRTSLLTCAILCVALLLVASLPPVDSWHREVQTGLHSFASGGSSTPPEYPYLFPPSEYPAPSNLSAWGATSLVRLTTSISGTDYMLFANDSGQALWLSSGTYNPNDTVALLEKNACISGSGPTCVPTQSVYLSWSTPLTVWPVTAGYSITADAMTSVGSTIVVAFSLSKSGSGSVGSEVYSSSNGGGSWVSLGSIPSGVVTSVAANGEQVFVSSLASGSLTVSTFSLSVPAASIDGSGAVRCTNGSCTATLTTHHAGDLIIAFCAMGTTSYTPTISDSAGLSWVARATNQSAAPGLYEFYAMAPTALSSDSIKCAISVGSINQDLIVFGVAGANPDSPFDPSSSVPASSYVSSGGGTPSATMSLSNSNDLLLGLLTVWVSGCGYPSPGSGFSLIAKVGSPPCDQADYEVTTTAGSHVVNYASTGGFPYAFIADAVEESSPPVTSISLGSAGAYQNASVAWTSTSSGGRVVAVASSAASGTISQWTSSNGGTSFSSPQTIATFNTSVPSASFNAIGDTTIVPPGGLPGQLVAVPAGAGVFVLYTTRVEGRVQASTIVSSSGGQYWQGPNPLPVPQGSIVDPTAAVSPTGEIEVGWLEGGNASGQVGEALFSPSGGLLGSPGTVTPAGPVSASGVPSGPPALGVDWLGRPILAWPTASPGAASAILYTGEFPSVNATSRYLSNLVNDPVAAADFPSLGVGHNQSDQLAAFKTTASTTIASLASDLSTAKPKVSAVQDATVDIAQNVTLFPIHVTTPGVPSVTPSNSLLAPLTGAFTANYYLADYAEMLLNSVGVSVSTSPLASPGVTPGPTPGVATPSFSASYSGYGQAVTATVTVIPQSPTSVMLQFTSFGWPVFAVDKSNKCPTGGGSIYWDNSSVVTSSGTKVTLLAGNNPSWSISGTPSSPIYLTNLTPDENYTWDAWFNATYQQTYSWDYCGDTGSEVISPPTISPSSIHLSILGAWASTTLGIVPHQPYMLSGSYSHGQTFVPLTAQWSNTMLADSSIWANGTTISNTTSELGTGYAIAYDTTLSALPVNQSYAATVLSTSESGGLNSSQTPSLSAGSAQNYPPEQSSVSCSFNLWQPQYTLWWSAKTNVTNQTVSQTQIQWSSNVTGIGVVTYYELGTGLNYTISGIPATENYSTKTYNYSVILRSLDSFARYYVTVGVGQGSGCLDKVEVGTFSFLTPHVLTLIETDLPYDSITKTGGGAQASWYLPTSFLSKKPTLMSAGLVLNNSSATIDVPESAQTLWQPGGSNLFIANFTPTQINSGYTVQVWLNYTGSGGNFNITSVPQTFTYLKETTTDGLTDLEKDNGWFVPVSVPSSTLVGGIPEDWNGFKYTGLWVGAQPSQYATNGLVGDYVEKQLDLDPFTVDTAESGMLDTWNLTFNLGAGSPSLPSGLQYWYENSTYHPFNNTSPSSSMQNLTNITPTAQHGPTSGDGSSWAARALWSTSALWTFFNLTGVQDARIQDGQSLRATTGTWKGIRTLTVWGKLSWGADPLVASTVFDGIPDGERVNPVANESLEIASLTCTETGLSTSSNSFAVEFTVRNGIAKSGAPELQNYSAPTVVSSSSKSISGYSVSIPVSQTSQDQTLQVEVIANEDGTDYALPFNGTQWEANITLDMVNGAAITYSPPPGSGSKNATLSFTLERTETGAKATTWLWLPATNSTTNGLPLGLERYTGEQAFDLVVVNASSSMSLTGVPLPWGSTYPVNLTQGLNNFLIPREQFLNSTFGEAILRGFASPYTSGANPAMIANGSSSWDYLHALGGANLMVDLASYWQNRAIWNSAGAIDPKTEPGTPDKNSQSVHVVAVDGTVPPANNTGGDPNDPTLENATTSGAALQTVLTLNVTNTTQLQLLLAGLLDNSTGGLNGSFQNITLQVPFIGLAAPIVSALANQAIAGEGLYGAPTTSIPGQTSPSSNLWGAFWDACTAVAKSVIGAVISLVEVVWSIATEATTFFDHLFRAALALGGTLLNRTVTRLEVAGRALVNATRVLYSVVLAGIEILLSPLTRPIQQFESTSFGAQASALAAYAASGGPSNSPTSSELSTFASGIDPMLTLTTGLATAMEVAALVLAPVAIVVGPLGPFFVIIFGSLLSEKLGSAGRYLPSLGFASVSGFVNSAGSFADGLMGSGSVNSLTESDIALIEVLSIITSFVVGLLAAAIASENGAGAISAISLGVSLALLGFSVSAIAYQQTPGITSSQYNASRAVALLCAVGSLGLDIVALPRLSVSGAAVIIGAVVFALDGFLLYEEVTHP